MSRLGYQLDPKAYLTAAHARLRTDEEKQAFNEGVMCVTAAFGDMADGRKVSPEIDKIFSDMYALMAKCRISVGGFVK